MNGHLHFLYLLPVSVGSFSIGMQGTVENSFVVRELRL